MRPTDDELAVLRDAGVLSCEVGRGCDAPPDDALVQSSARALGDAIVMCVSTERPAADFDAMAHSLNSVADALLDKHDMNNPDPRELRLAADAMALGARALSLYLRHKADEASDETADAGTARGA